MFQQNNLFQNQIQPNQTQVNQNQKHYNTNLNFYHTYTIAVRFGIQFTLVSENKIGKSDNKEYKKWSVLIKIIPPGNEPMTYDSMNSFTMKTNVDNISALSGAFLSVFYNQPTKFTIFTDPTKSQYTNDTDRKTFTLSNIDKNNNVITDAYLGASMGNKVNAGMKIDRFMAYGFHKGLDEFVKKCYQIIFDDELNNKK